MPSRGRSCDDAAVAARLAVRQPRRARLVTLLSTIRSNQGWIRVFDFPRLLELIAIGVIALGCALFLRGPHRLLPVALALAAG